MKKSGHGGNLKYYSEKYKIPQSLLIDFSANINPLGPDKNVFEVISANLQSIKDYPEPNSEALLRIAEEEFNIPQDNFIFGNGAAELLFLLVNYLKPNNVFIPAPSFSEYEIAAKAVKANINFFDLKDDFTNFDNNFLEKVSEGDIVFICNPNNPTGTFFDKNLLINLLLEINKKNAYFFVDESFIDFIEDKKYFSLREETGEENNLFVLYSLTKIYGIPGLRLGMLFGNPSVINNLYERKDPWNVNIFAQKAGEVLLKDKDFILKTKKYFFEERERIYNNLKEIKEIKPYKPSANFIFIEILRETNVEELQEYLIKEKILIRNCSNYPGLNNKFFRIAIKGKIENDFIVSKLYNYFSNQN
jgi:threonine-phosphate decarboxylase